MIRRFGALLGLVALGCSGRTAEPSEVALWINEVVSDNEGVWLDEHGAADDYVLLFIAGDAPVGRGDFVIVDSSGIHALPAVEVPPRGFVLLWADDSPEQGALHLPFKIDNDGERLSLERSNGALVDSVDVPALEEHHAFSRLPDGTGPFAVCGWATPGRSNGAECGPPPVVDTSNDESFLPYTWPERWPEPSSPLVITELALRPAAFIEVLNGGDEAVQLGDYSLRVAPHVVGHPWPDAASGVAVAWPEETELEPGERVVLEVTEEDVSTIAEGPDFEGVVTVFHADTGEAVDRLDFAHFPENAALARVPELGGTPRYCIAGTPGAENDACEPLPARAVGDHVRGLRTPGDLAALGAGEATLGMTAAKFLVDMTSGDVVTLLDGSDWDLHYTYIRERIDGLPALDRCEPAQREEFNLGWWEFSEREYFRVEGRRYLLGTLVHHAGADLYTVEFSPGDVLSGEQMKHAFFTVMRHVPEPERWVIRPQPEQVERARAIDGEAPIVSSDAPFRGLSFQLLTPGVAFGTLRFVPAAALKSTALGPRDIVVTDQVPNDIPLVAGLITEAFQTPLSHVNILSRGRGTPNLALANARADERLAPYLETLVRFEVTGSAFTIEEADPEEALEFWQSRLPSGPPLAPRLDTTVRGVQPLPERSIDDIPSIGGKAAQFAELYRVPLCAGASVPPSAFAVPVVHSIEHFAASGAAERFAELRADASFEADPLVRGAGLAEIRELIEAHPVQPDLLAEVTQAIAERFPGIRVRFRSSSNVEDLGGFNGAGLYDSTGVDPDELDGGIEDALREIWASLWNLRAYDERAYYHIDQTALGMAVLVHPAYPSERANGVAISRNIFAPSEGHKYYINAQVGEALVTNPAPGVTSDQIVYQPGRPSDLVYQSRSSLSGGEPVLTAAEVADVACSLRSIHDHYRALLDPDGENTWFAMDIEFKLLGASRQLLIKQARPYSFGTEPPSDWCDF